MRWTFKSSATPFRPNDREERPELFLGESETHSKAKKSNQLNLHQAICSGHCAVCVGNPVM
jgi:hypothetical protein